MSFSRSYGDAFANSEAGEVAIQREFGPNTLKSVTQGKTSGSVASALG